MKSDPDRAQRIQEAIQVEGLDAILCAYPKNTLLITGYWPIIGNSVAIADREGQVALIVPEDEYEYIRETNCDQILRFKAEYTAPEDIRGPLERYFQYHNYRKIGIERGPISQEASYVAMTLYGDSLLELIREIIPKAQLIQADHILNYERAILTTSEQGKVRVAVAIAGRAFEMGRNHIQEGVTEWEIAQAFETPLSIASTNYPNVARARGIVSAMSGSRAGAAYGAFAMSSSKVVNSGETILIHANSQADGFWTDITRTYFIGEKPELISTMYEACFKASRESIGNIKAGIAAEEIDRIVRENLAEYGFEKQFKHATGHRVGYSAIDHTAFPKLAKHSLDILKSGMVINIEPGIYFENFGGMRLCDMVLVTESGAELLTPFHRTTNELHVSN